MLNTARQRVKHFHVIKNEIVRKADGLGTTRNGTLDRRDREVNGLGNIATNGNVSTSMIQVVLSNHVDAIVGWNC